jgi:hypothetical protein
MMRCGVKPGNVLSSVLRARACRRDGVGGEQSAWWRKCAWLPAVEVAAMFAAIAMGGRPLVGSIVVAEWVGGVSSIIQCACICCRTGSCIHGT